MKKNKLQIKRLLSGVFLFLLLAFMSSTAEGQGFSVKGTVSSNDGPLPGVTVLEKGTTNGTTTNSTGKYRINVSSSDAVLVFSFVGYQKQEEPVSGRSTIDLVLGAGTQQLQDVVVTALGIKRSERSLGYSVGTVSGEETNEVNTTNFTTALAGRVPGVKVSSTRGPGSTVSVNIRGLSSLTGGNQPLYVVDGVPVNSSMNNAMEIGDRNHVDYGNVISDIDPNNIENITVLKGPSASALYGSRAGGGVILITTKKGSKNKGLGVSINSKTEIAPIIKVMPLMKSKFAAGKYPYTPDNLPPGQQYLTVNSAEEDWNGPRLDKGYKAIQWNSPEDENGNKIPTPLKAYPNFRNFFRTAVTSTNNVSISNASDRSTYRLSYSNMTNKGSQPNTGIDRNNISANISYDLLDNLTISTDINYAKTHSDNRPTSQRGTNPIYTLEYINPSVDIRELRDYWEPGKEGIQQRDDMLDMDNPWFLAYEANNGFTRDHIFGNVRADWQITSHIGLMVRYSLDNVQKHRETRVSKSYTRAPNGIYGLQSLKSYERNTEFLASYQNTFGDFDLNASVGGNARYNKNTSFRNSTNSAGFSIPNLFNLGNVLPTSLNFSNYWSQKGVRSLYATASLGFKQMIYLNLTGRNDWSSTLPVDNRSYFYPSTSLSVLLDQALNMPSYVSLFKIRGGIAQAGKAASAYQLVPTLGNAGAWGGNSQLSVSGTLLNPNLKPEIKTSQEFGIDLSFVNNRFRLSGTYYSSDNKNQILHVDLPRSSGYNSKLINAGLVRSKGVELSVGLTPTKPSSPWTWDVNVNFMRNRTTIEKLTPEMKEGHKPFILWTGVKGGAWTYVGEEVGNMYDRKPARVTDPKSEYYQWPIIEPNGDDPENLGSDPKNARIVGNFNSDFIMGLQTSLSFKGFTFSANLSWRKGGDFYSETYRYPESDYHFGRFKDEFVSPDVPRSELPNYIKEHAQELLIDRTFLLVGGPDKDMGGLEYTENGVTHHNGFFQGGVMKRTDANGNFVEWEPQIGGPNSNVQGVTHSYPWSFGSASLFPADFIKLREVSIAYSFPDRIAQSIHLQDLSVAVYSRNIKLWTKAKIGIDPEHAFEDGGGPGGFKQGVEHNNAMPWLLPIGIRLSLKF